MQTNQRQTAFKIRISDLLSGKYNSPGGWEPSYISVDGVNVSRANIIGVVVAKQSSEMAGNESIMLDDGSGRISVRSFEQRDFSSIKVGDLVMLIGRPKEYGDEVYIVPEIIKALSDRRWVDVRKAELGILNKKSEDAQTCGKVAMKETGPIENRFFEDKAETEDIEKDTESPTEKILSMIKGMDKGDGADFGEVIKNSKVEDAETRISDLLKNGEIFELRPGKLKIL